MYLLASEPATASIAELKEIPSPPPVSWMPQTAGWWVIAAIALLGLLVFAFIRWRTWWRNRYRRAAKAELATLERAMGDPLTRKEALAAIPALVKRTVLTWAPRDAIAPMTGEVWLRYLDRTYPEGGFVRGPGRHLDALAYGKGEISNDEVAVLLAWLHRWIDGHAAA